MRSNGARVECRSLSDIKRFNLIPIGRQLQRTPPAKTQAVDTHTRHQPEEEPEAEHEEDQQMVLQDGTPSRQDDTPCTPVKDERMSCRRSSITSASAKMGNADHEAFVQGMQGYRWTDADLEFVYQSKQQKRAQQLQQELGEVEKTLQAETQRLELAIASRDQLQPELSKTPSCDSLLQLCKSVLSVSRTSDQLDGLGDKALLSLLTLQDVQRAAREQNAEISRLEKQADKARELREKEKTAMKEMDNCQKKISTLQGNVDALKVELAELKTRLSKKEEASKAVRGQKEIRKAAKAQANDVEEMKTSSQVLVESQVPEKGRKGSRRAKPSTEAVKEKVLKGRAQKERASKETAEEGKTAPKEKAPKKTTLKKTAKKEMSSDEMAANETPSQVKTTVETDPDKMPPRVKFSNITEVLEKGRKVSRTTIPKDKAQKKPTLKDSTKNEVVPMETSEGEVVKKGKTAPKIKAPKKTTSRTAQKELAQDEKTSPVKTQEETGPEETSLKEMAPEKLTPARKVLEKGHKESRTINPPTTALKEKRLRKTALREGQKGQKETVQTEADEKGKRARKVKAPKKVLSKNTAENEMTPEEATLRVKTLDEDFLEEMAPKSETKELLKKTALTSKAPEEVSLEETPPKVRASKLKPPKMRAAKKTAELTVEGTTVTKKMTTKKRASKKDLKETPVQELTEDEDSLNCLKEQPKKETAVENEVKQKTDPEETTSEKMDLMARDEEATSTRQSQKKKVKAPKEMPEKETRLKETVSRRKAPKEKVPKQKAEKNQSEDEDSSNAARVQGRAQRPTKPPKPPSESDAETVRRSKRTAGKNPGQNKTPPGKTTRSRRR